MSAPSPGRLPALDRLRAVALLAMLVHHLTGWYGGSPRERLPGWSGFAVTDVAAPAFVVAAGAALTLFATSRTRKVGTARLTSELLRRYGMLIPLGMGLLWVLWRDPFGFGVLECLGLVTLATAVVVLHARPAAVATLALACLVAGPVVERAVGEGTSWFEREVLAGTFPAITYLGFALVGAALVGTGAARRRRAVLAVAAVLVAATAAGIATGHPPERYPGGPWFVVPGLAGTFLVYGAALCWPAGHLRPLDVVLRRAGAHTLGIFVAHYGIYFALSRLGALGDVPGDLAVPAAAATALALALVAPLVPQAPWSPRTGRRRRTPVIPLAR